MPATTSAASNERTDRRLDDRSEEPTVALTALLGQHGETFVGRYRLNAYPGVDRQLEPGHPIGCGVEPGQHSPVVETQIPRSVVVHPGSLMHGCDAAFQEPVAS